MPCEFTRVDSESGPSIRIENDQLFDQDIFLDILSSIPLIELNGVENLVTSTSPAETVDQVDTSRGILTISKEFDGEDPCVFIWSDNNDLTIDLMDKMNESLWFKKRK